MIAKLFPLLFTLFDLPVVCGDLWSGAFWISDVECSEDEQPICEPGESVVGSLLQVCCPNFGDGNCRAIGPTLLCFAVESNACDAPLASDEIFCHDGDHLYRGAPLCDAGDSVVCIEGEFDGPDAVCCTGKGCKVRDSCQWSEVHKCSGTVPEWQGQICMNNMLTYLDNDHVCDPGTEHVCNVGDFGVPDPYAIACCADDLDCIPTTYPGVCPLGYDAKCEMN